MREGLQETPTVVRLGLSGSLQRTRRSTNPIENLNGSVQRHTRNFKRWRGGEMIQRWVSAALLDSARLSDQTLLYVQMSRASDEFVLLTDDREALAKILLRRPGREEGALEAIGEALTAPPVVEPEVFERLRADWTAVRTRARAAGDIAYLTEGYTEVMARVAALSAIEDLPADMRRFTEALLAEHGQHRERERIVTELIRRMQSHWRRWSRLGGASPDPRAEETPARREWRADADRMLGTARGWLGEGSDIARHFDAVPGARTGLETAVREGVPAIDVAGYAEVAALGLTLVGADALDADERENVDAWRRAHEEVTGHRDAMERYPGEVAALMEARYNLDLRCDVDGGFDPAHSGYRTLRTDAENLLSWGRSMLALHLPAHPERPGPIFPGR